jgi:histidine ammonia-lyase
MGTIAARQAQEVVNNVEHIIACELLCAAQGVDIRALTKQVTLGRGTHIAFKEVREVVPRSTKVSGVNRDRISHDVLVHRDIATLWQLVHSGELLREVKTKISRLSA